MNHQKHNVQQQQQQVQLQFQRIQQQQQQQQQQAQQTQPQIKRRSNLNRGNKLAATNRKRSHSSSSTSSSESTPVNLFSNASSSDSGSSSMASTKPSLSRKKRATNNSTGNSTDSPSADSGTSQAQSSSSSSFASSNTNAPPLLPPPSSSSGATTSSSAASSSSAPPPRLTAQRSVPAFLNKLYNMVEDPTTNDLVRWSKDGTSFIVERHEVFAKTVLPRFYKHNTFASFVRQLNMYDFHKVPHLQQGVMIAENEYEIWEFSNPHFQRGRPDLLVLVTRKRNRDKDIVDTENVTLSTLVQDLSAIKKQQSSIGTDLRDLHRDNEILWQETLNAREKYQSHQEAIEKILQFLTAIFANDHLAISMNNGDSLPRGLIEEAASLAGMSTKLDDMSKINSSAPMSSSLASSALSNIFSSAIRLYSTSNSPDQRSTNQANKTEDDKPMPNSFESVIQYPQSPQEMTSDQDKAPSIMDFSRTLNIATRSAQSITQDIDMLQVNIESLANNLGVDPSQFDDDMEADIGLHDNYSHMLSTVNQPNDTKLYAIADTNPELYDSYRRKSENMTNVVPNQFSFNIQKPPPPPSSRQYQQQQQQQQQQQHDNNNSNNTTAATAATISNNKTSQSQSLQPQTRPVYVPLQPPPPQPQMIPVPPIQRVPQQHARMQRVDTSQQQQRLAYGMQGLPNEKPLQPDINSADGSYRRFLNSMNYPDAYYPIGNESSDFHQAQRNSFESTNSSNLMNRRPITTSRSNSMNFYGSISPSEELASTNPMANNPENFNASNVVNPYSDTMRTRYFNNIHGANGNEENFNESA